MLRQVNKAEYQQFIEEHPTLTDVAIETLTHSYMQTIDDNGFVMAVAIYGKNCAPIYRIDAEG